MLTKEEVGEVPPWPGMAQACLLELLPSPVEPLGFVGFDIMLSPEISRQVSGWICDDVGGRVLLHARPEHLYQGPLSLQPLRTVPLLMWLTHRCVRVLYQCTPTEAFHLGSRLTELGPKAVGSDRIEECSPASLIDLLWRWMEEDPQIPAMPGPDEEGKLSAPEVAPWRCTWQSTQLEQSGRTHELPRPGRFTPPPGLEDADYMTYEDDPTVLVPARLVLENPLLTPQEVMDILSGDEDIHEPLIAGAHGGLACQAGYRELTVLAPVLGESWRERLRTFRDRLALRAGGEVVCNLAERKSVVQLCRSVRRRLKEMTGADEVYHPPLPGARRTPPEPTDARELRLRLMNAVALPLFENALHQLQVGEMYN